MPNTRRPRTRNYTCHTVIKENDRMVEYYYRRPERLAWANTAKTNVSRRARKTGTTTDLSLSDLAKLAVDVCPIMSIPLVYARGRGRMRDDSPAVIRLNTGLGWVAGNCVVVSNRAAMSLAKLSDDERVMLAEWILAHRTAS